MPDANDSQTPSGNADGDPPPPLPVVPTIERRVVALEAESRARNEEKERDELLKDVRTGEWWMISINGALLIATIVIAFIYVGQLNQMTIATQASTDAVRIAGDSFLISSGDFERTMRQTIYQTGAQITSAEAAKDSVETTQTQMRLDERAWLGFGSMSLVLDKTKPIKVETMALILGKSPAVNIVTKLGFKTFASDHMLQLKDLVLDPKEIHNGTAFPGNVFPLRETASDPISENDKLVIDGVLGKKIFICFFGETSYRDIFKNPHWTHFCYAISSADAKESRPCEIHNDSDADTQAKY